MGAGAFRGFQVFVVTLCLICLGLGTWQIQRYYWKADLKAAARAVAQGQPVDLQLNVASLPSYQPLRLTGQFLGGYDIAIVGHAVSGVSGSRMFAPFQLTDGRLILMHRGWVIRGQERTRGVDNTALQTLEAYWQPVKDRAQRSPLFSQVNAPEYGLWTHVNLAQMAAYWGNLPLLDGGYAQLRGPAAASDGTRIEAFAPDLSDRHLEYVATWYAMALILACIYILIWRERRKATV